MGLILSIGDFDNGRYRMALDPEQEIDLDNYIDRVENEYLPKLFGKELYDLFIIDWNAVPFGTPSTPRFTQVYNEFTVQNDCVMAQSLGIYDMLRGFVYYLFLRDDVTRSSTLGLVKMVGENAESVTAIQHDITSRYNEAVDTFLTIQYYMSEFEPKPLAYPEYKGVGIAFANIF
jgi:hypothetical protein